MIFADALEFSESSKTNRLLPAVFFMSVSGDARLRRIIGRNKLGVARSSVSQPSGTNMSVIQGSPTSWGSLWRHRDLLWQFTKRQIEGRHRGSLLGFGWSILNPLLMLGIYTFVFSVIFPGHFTNQPNQGPKEYALTVFIGLACFHLLVDSFAVAPSIIVTNPNFVKKVVFPLEILPAAAVGAAVFHFLIILCLFFIGAFALGISMTWTALWAPVIFLPLILISLGGAWLLSALGVFLRDLQQLVGFTSLVLMWASAIFFSPLMIPPAVWAVLKFNPLLRAIDLARQSIMWGQHPSPLVLAYLYGFAILTIIVGYTVFRKARPAFADVL